MRIWLELAHYHCPIHSYPVAQQVIWLCNGPSSYASGQRLGIRVEHICTIASAMCMFDQQWAVLFAFAHTLKRVINIHALSGLAIVCTQL